MTDVDPTDYVPDPDGTIVLLHRVVEGREVVEAHDVGPRHTWSLAHRSGEVSPLAVRFARRVE